MHYEAVLIYVGEVLQNNVKNKLIVETPLKRMSKGVALSDVWAVDTAWLKRPFYIIGSLSNNDGDGYEHVTSKVNHAASSFITLILSRLIRQMLAGKFLWRWVPKDCIKVQERKRRLFFCVPILNKTWN